VDDSIWKKKSPFYLHNNYLRIESARGAVDLKCYIAWWLTTFNMHFDTQHVKCSNDTVLKFEITLNSSKNITWLWTQEKTHILWWWFFRFILIHFGRIIGRSYIYQAIKIITSINQQFESNLVLNFVLKCMC
jgi:hypothetical protein